MSGKRDTSDKETFGGFIRARREPGKNLVRVDATDSRKLAKPDVEAAKARLEHPLDQTLPRPLEHKPSKAWPKKSLIKGKKVKLSIMTLSEDTLSKADPKYAECLRLANSYRKHRAREFVVAHGFVSAGVSAMLSTAALSLAASRYLYEKAADGQDVSLLKDASKLSTDARQTELAAWELCAREAVARKKAATANEISPWLKPKAEEKRGRGRPRKDKHQTVDPFAEVVNGLYSSNKTSSGQIITAEAEISATTYGHSSKSESTSAVSNGRREPPGADYGQVSGDGANSRGEAQTICSHED